MICPNCHGMDDALPNCVRCGHKGGLCDKCGKAVFAGMDLCWSCHVAWKKNLTADGAEDADKTKEDTVKTFAQRLEALRRRLQGKIMERDHGLPEHARLNFWSEVKLVPRFLASAPADTVTAALLRTLTWMASESDLVEPGEPILGFDVLAELVRVLAMLEAKNASYGNTALEPVRTFSSGSALDLLYARADDKLSRLRTAATAFEEDALMDLAGYLVLILLALEDEGVRKSLTADGADGKSPAAKSAEGAEERGG